MKKVQSCKRKRIDLLTIKRVPKNLLMIYKNQGMNQMRIKVIKKINRGNLIPG